MKITEEQLKILATLKCERLSSDDNNLRLVEEFFNKKESLSNTLKNEAYEDDEAGNIVYFHLFVLPLPLERAGGEAAFYFRIPVCVSLLFSLRLMLRNFFPLFIFQLMFRDILLP